MADEQSIDTTETVLSSDASEVNSLLSTIANKDADTYTIKSTSSLSRAMTDVTEEDIAHDNIPSDYRHKEQKEQHLQAQITESSPSPSPSAIFKQKESLNVALLKILDSKPVILQGHNEAQPGSDIVDKIFNEIYFDGNWNRGHYELHSDDEDYPEYQSKLEQQNKFHHPLTVFGDDDLFTLLPSQVKQNREQSTFYSQYEFKSTPYPLPSQRLKRVLYPFRTFKNAEEKTPNFAQRLEAVNNAEQEYYGRIRGQATKLKDFYTEMTAFQTNVHTSALFAQKKEFWYKLQYEMNEQNVGVVSEHNIPPWIIGGWYGDCALARNRNLRMPQYKAKTFKSFYPKTARWDRIMRGCYELDWKDEDIIMDIIKYDEEELKTPMAVILSLRRAKLFGEEAKSWTEFKPFARDPFIHIYDFYGVSDDTLSGACTNDVYRRMRDLYWTLNMMWFIASRFDADGCLRCPALINPIEWQYCVALKLIWDGIKLFGLVGKLHTCSLKHCGIKDAGNKTMQFLKKVTYAFDFDEKQIYDFRFILYLLRHTLYNHLFHVLSKHAGKYQLKVFSKQKKDAVQEVEMAHHEDYRFVLDYFKFLVLSNNMYEFFSPKQMGRLWQYIAGTFEEFRMIYPEISHNTIENEYCDMLETHRHQSVTKTMTAKSYAYYCGNKYYTNKEKNVWQDAKAVVKQYCIKNTLFPVPDMFESLYSQHDIHLESNPTKKENKSFDDLDNYKYKRSKLEKYISEIVMTAIKNPTAFYLTEIKYPFLCNLIRACIKYEFHELAQLLLNHCITKAISTFDDDNMRERKSKNIFSNNAEYHHLNKSQKRYIDTSFSWPYVLFIEYLSFNPKQFHREHLCEILAETEHFKAAIRKEKQKYNNRSQRKILSFSNRIKLQKQKFNSWKQAAVNKRIPYYPLAALFRFAVSERTNSKLDENDELITEGTDFTITKCVISALQTIFKFPQFSTRILMNTHNLLHLVQNITYVEFKSVHDAIFKYNSKYQEKPQMYELFKKKWMEYAKLTKSLLNMYHDPHHKLHRELVWLGFYQYHQQCYKNNDTNSADRDLLFNYHAVTHMQGMKEKHEMDLEKQKNDFIADVEEIFASFGYAEDEKHRFFGNYYREFVEREEGHTSSEEEDDSDASLTDEGSESYQDSASAEEEDKKHDEEDDFEDDDDDDAEYSFEDDDDDSSYVSTEEEAASKKEVKEEEEEDLAPPKHRRMNTETQERAQFANQFDIEDVEDDNPFGRRYDDSDEEDVVVVVKDEEEKEEASLNIEKEDDLDDFDDLDDLNEVKETKTRGSNEYNAEELKHINTAESPLLTNIKEDHASVNEEEEEDEMDLNPFGLPPDDEEEESEEKQANDNNNNNDNDTKQPQTNDNNNNNNDNDNNDEAPNDDYDGGQNGFIGGADHNNDDDRDKDKKKKGFNAVDDKEDEYEDDEEEEEEDELGDLGAVTARIKQRQTSLNMNKMEEKQEDDEVEMVEALNLMVKKEEEETTLIPAAEEDVHKRAEEMKVNIGNTVRHLAQSKRGGMLFGDNEKGDNVNEEEEEADDDDDDDDIDSDDDDTSASDEEDDDLIKNDFRANKEWANTLLNNENIAGMQSRDAILQRKEEQEDLYKRHQVIGLKEDEEENLYSILDLENTQFIDECMFGAAKDANLSAEIEEFGWNKKDIDCLVADIAKKEEEAIVDEEEEQQKYEDVDYYDAQFFDDEQFFSIKNARWNAIGKTDPICSIAEKEADNSYIMLRDLVEPLSLSELLGDFQKAGQIMLSRIDDMQASLIVENKLHCSVLKAHQMDEKQLYSEREELLATNEKLEDELKLLRDKRDAKKLETAALKTKQESLILKYNELKEISTQKLRDQLRCFEIYRSQTKQFEKRISDASFQTEIGYKRLNRLCAFKKQQQLNISQLDLEMESIEKEKLHKSAELQNLEEEQLCIDGNEAQYVLRLKEQLRRLGKGMENKEKSCNIYRRNVVEERLRIHAIDDSLKKLRTNANPTTSSDQELINATQHEALQAREKYAERSQQHSFLTNIHHHERVLIDCIDKVQNIDDEIYAKKWNIVQKSWNLKKELLETGKLIQMKKYLLKKEKSHKKHKKKLSQVHFRNDSMSGLSRGASTQFKKQSQDFSSVQTPKSK